MGRSCALCGVKQAAVLLGPRSARNVGGEEEADAAHAAQEEPARTKAQARH
jgi:hypothetical protein